MKNKKEILLVFGIILGILLVAQGKSMTSVKEILIRDSGQSVFQEIKIFKDKNKELNKDLIELGKTYENLYDQDLAIEAIVKDIKKYKKLSGQYPVFGQGIELIVNSDITAPYVIDIINELNNAGANAIAINGIRITNQTNGIDVMPSGQIFIDSFVMSKPYKITALGEPKTMSEILYLAGGIIERVKSAFPETDIIVQTKDVIQMN